MQGRTVVEWSVQYREGAPLTERPPYMFEKTPVWTEETALAEQEKLMKLHEFYSPGYPKVFRRERIVYPDVVNDWQETSGTNSR